MKFAIYQKIVCGDWQNLHSWKRIRSDIPWLCKWLNEMFDKNQSLMDRPVTEWEDCFKKYLQKYGGFRKGQTKRISVSASINVKINERESDSRLTTFRSIYKVLEDTFDKLFATDTFEKDIWNLKQLNACDIDIAKSKTLNFNGLYQDWLKAALKKYFKHIIYIESANTCRRKLTDYWRFSKFLYKNYPKIEPNGITREVIVNYLAWLNLDSLSSSSKLKGISSLKVFFDYPETEKWLGVNLPKYLVLPDDYPKLNKCLPRYIPDDILIQINQNLDSLRSDIMRMVLLLQETGRRATEITHMPFDCLVNSSGNWFLKHPQFKMNDENTIPISQELARVILEQQKETKKEWGNNIHYLFPTPKPQGKGKPMSYTTFAQHLKRLIVDRDIRDKHGNLYNLTFHQFRHTVGTSMINKGVPLHIIQRYLGHTSPEMTLKYAHIHDETLRKEIEKYHETQVVNFQGETAELEDTVLASGDDLEWFKKTVQARALEHGYCARPKLLGDCDIPGFDGCYNCPHWRTNKNFLPVLKDTLQRTENVLSKARNCGWELQVKKNEPVKTNLEKVIKSLEEAS